MTQVSFVQNPQDNMHAQQKKYINPGNRVLCEKSFYTELQHINLVFFSHWISVCLTIAWLIFIFLVSSSTGKQAE